MDSQDDTRSRILDAAEQLFAQHGFDGTSVRQITRDAGVNVAAVHYHFGSKEAVLRGVTDRVAGPIGARRQELLDDALAAAAPGAPTVESLLDAFLRADIELLVELQARRPKVARFMGRTYADQTPWIQQMAQQQFAPGLAFVPHVAAALPHLAEEEVLERLRWVVAVIVNLFATWPENGMAEAEAHALLDRLVAFLTAGLEAPTTRR